MPKKAIVGSVHNVFAPRVHVCGREDDGIAKSCTSIVVGITCYGQRC